MRDPVNRATLWCVSLETADRVDVLDGFHPIVATWFRDRFHTPTEPQLRGWPVISSGRDALIAAPTGSGKTLAAFLSCLDRLIQQGLAAPLPDATSILYISPLKALSNDVHRNLQKPLAELHEVAAAMELQLPAIRAAVRTGDTPQSERAKMARKPPHILVTTPESFYILLTSKSGRKALAQVGTVIVDEIHAVARDKRGAHLTLSLERLDRLVSQTTGRKPVRVGLSATQKPIELIARMLGGTRRQPPHIIDGGHARALDIAIEMTDDELGAIASHEQMGRVYDRIAELAQGHDTTLVFVNTRRMVERVSHQLERRLGEEQVVAHHGSMSRKLRFAAEQKLKNGTVRVAVATASLELGIDVGSVDLVVQVGSPRSIATLLQRIGRSGHSLGATPKGRLFALTRDQLVECAALVRAILAKNLDAVEPRVAPLDILAQQLVASAACEELPEDEAFELVRGSFHYSALEREAFDSVVHMLSEGVSDRRGRLGAHLHRDRIGGVIKGRRGARIAAMTSGGAIPDNANYNVVLYPDETRVGTLDEDFAIESSAGDIFLLGNTSWRIRRVESGRVIVEDAQGLPPTVPFWLGEAPARTIELSDEVSRLRADVESQLVDGRSLEEVSAWAQGETHMPGPLAGQMVAYLSAARAALGAMPTGKTLVAERFFDEGGGMQLVIHAPLGGRINRGWGLALRKRFCRSFNFELQAAATDDGIVISLGQPHSFPLESVFSFLSSGNVEEVLVQALLDSPMFEIRWRWNVTRSLVLPRWRGGKKVPPHILRMKAGDLASVVFPQQQACLETVVGDREVPDHPLVGETVRDCLTEAMDIDGLQQLIADIESGAIRVVGRDTVEPSPLSHELISANPYAFLDDAPLEERRTRAVSLRRGLRGVEDGMRSLEATAIAQAEDEARFAVRDADELHDALMSLYALPEASVARLAAQAELWHGWFDELLAAGRATRLVRELSGARADNDQRQQHVLWVAAERLPIVRVAFAEADETPALGPLPFAVEVPEPEMIDVRIVGAQLDYSGPRSARGLCASLGLPADRVLAALFALEADGAILRGTFTAAASAAGSALGDLDIEWCNRLILARIHRLTLAHLRSQVQAVSPAALMRFLFRWQRLSPGTQIFREEGALTIVEQLQGFESAAGAWEREILPARLHEYQPAWLDALCLSGQTAWCRLSPRRRPAATDEPDADGAGDDTAVETTEATEATEAESRDQVEPADPSAADSGDDDAAKVRDKRASGRKAPTKAAPLTLMLRRDMLWLRAPAVLSCKDGDDTYTPTGLSEQAQSIHQHLLQRGASFLAEIARALEVEPVEVEDGLWELVSAGLATADGFASLRVLVDRARGESRSVFDGRTRRAPVRNRKWLEAVSKARRRDRYRPTHAVRSLPTAAGRWSLLGRPSEQEIDVEAHARQLLCRYGVVFRDLLARESNLPPWRELLREFRRMEARGEIRGGRFVATFVGQQFALPEAVEGLRAMRKTPSIDEFQRVAATDPLNLVGVTSAGPKVPAVIGNAVLYRNGVPLASIEAGEVMPRSHLEEGARVDEDLVYHPPPPAVRASAQVSLPFS